MAKKGVFEVKNGYAYILLLLIGIGAFLRFYQLSFNSLTLDEAATYDFARRSLADIWNATAQGEYNPPLFYWLEHSMLFFGNTEFILRLIPALIGIATIPVTYLIGREFADRNTGTLAAAMMTVSPFHIYYSQDARAYTLVTFFIMIAFYFFLKGIEKGERGSWIFCGLFAALAFWSHFYALILIGLLFGLAFLFNWVEFRKIKNVIPGLLIFAVATLPLLMVMVRLFFIRVATPPVWGTRGIYLIYLTLFKFSYSNIYVLGVFLILFCAGMAALFPRNKDKLGLLLTILLVPLAASVVLSYKIDIVSYYLIYLMPFFYLGIGLAGRFHRFNRPYINYAFILSLMIVSIPRNHNYYTQLSKSDWRGLGNYLQDTAQPQDLVVIIPGYDRIPFDYYYSRRPGNTTIVDGNTLSDLIAKQASKGNGTVYYVLTANAAAANPEGTMRNWLEKNTNLLKNYAGDLQLYKR
jgi:mannosyltransferase